MSADGGQLKIDEKDVLRARARTRAGNAMRGIGETSVAQGALGQKVFMSHPDSLRMLRNAFIELGDAIKDLEKAA